MKLNRNLLRKMILQEMKSFQPGISRSVEDRTVGGDESDLEWGDDYVESDDVPSIQDDEFSDRLSMIDSAIADLIANEEDPDASIYGIRGLPELLQQRTDIEHQMQVANRYK